MVRRVLEKVGLVLFGTLLAFVVGETATRLLERGPARITTPSKLSSNPTTGAAGGPTQPAGTNLREIFTPFELAAPNQRAMHAGKFYRTNSAGFRGPEYDPVPAADTFRIVVLGDSVTMGSGVLEEDTYSHVLETMLNAEHDGRRYEVLNMGVSAANIELVAMRFSAMAVPHHPDLVVYGFTPNDIEGPAYVYYTRGESGAWHTRWRARFEHSPSRLVSALGLRLISLADLLVHLPGSYEYELEQNYFHNPAAWRDFLGQLDRLAEIGRRQGICVHVLLHTTPYYLGPLHPFRRVYDAVAAAAIERGLTVTDAYREVFHGRDGRELVLSPDDLHPNPAGHRLLAESLRVGLRRLPRECWARSTHAKVAAAAAP